MKEEEEKESCVFCGWAMGEREGEPLCNKCGKGSIVDSLEEENKMAKAPNMRQAFSCADCKNVELIHCCGCCPTEYECSLYDEWSDEYTICDDFIGDE
ncbi:hypothetical protein LCGC14_3047000 [marine sediment metagenome]|uniref:Uncharacterized protein n=1 Tax=marine sediment metagenome TaxID=412755 RepID=A0A0F8WMT3_9ZZZZ